MRPKRLQQRVFQQYRPKPDIRRAVATRQYQPSKHYLICADIVEKFQNGTRFSTKIHVGFTLE